MTSATTLDRTARTGQSGQVSLTGQPGQVSLTGQPGQVSLYRTDRTGRQDMTARTGLWGQVSWGQERWSRKAGNGEVGQDRQTGQAGQNKKARGDSQDGAARKRAMGMGHVAGQSGYGIWT